MSIDLKWRKVRISSSRHTPPRHNLHRHSTRHHSRLPPQHWERLHLRGLQEVEWRGWKVGQREQARLQVLEQVLELEEEQLCRGEGGWSARGKLEPAAAGNYWIGVDGLNHIMKRCLELNISFWKRRYILILLQTAKILVDHKKLST